MQQPQQAGANVHVPQPVPLGRRSARRQAVGSGRLPMTTMMTTRTTMAGTTMTTRTKPPHRRRRSVHVRLRQQRHARLGHARLLLHVLPAATMTVTAQLKSWTTSLAATHCWRCRWLLRRVRRQLLRVAPGAHQHQWHAVCSRPFTNQSPLVPQASQVPLADTSGQLPQRLPLLHQLQPGPQTFRVLPLGWTTVSMTPLPASPAQQQLERCRRHPQRLPLADRLWCAGVEFAASHFARG